MKKQVYHGKMVGGEREFSRFGQLARFLRMDAKPKLAQAKNNALKLIGNNIAVEMMDSLGSHQWAPLEQSTIDQKTRKNWGRNGDPSGQLFATGKMWDDISYRVWRSLDEVEVGTDKDFAAYLEYGTGKMKPRPFVRDSYRKALPESLKFAELMLGDAAGGA